MVAFMNADVVAALINLGSAGAVIIVVVYFLNFIRERDKQWHEFFNQIYSIEQSVFLELKASLEAVRDELLALRNDVRNHDQVAREAIKELSKRRSVMK